MHQPIILKWLGVAAIELNFNNNVLLVDPFLTRPPLRNVFWGRPMANSGLLAEKIPRADHILVTHAHYDHYGSAAALRELTSVLGLQLEPGTAQGAEAAPFIDLLLELRTKLRAAKQYALADEVRIRLTELGVIVEDTREGSSWRIG